MPRGVAGARHHAAQIDRHDLVEVGEVVVEELRCMVLDTPALLTITCSPPNRSTAVVTSPLTWSRSRHIGLDEVRVGADVVGQRRTGVAVDVGDQHLGAFGGESPRQPFAQSRRTAGDDRDLALEFVAHLAGCPFASHVAEKVQQQFVDGVGLFDLRAVTCPVDDGRTAVRDLLGDLGRPALGQQFVARALDHQRRHGDAVVGALARRQWRWFRPGRRNLAAANASHAPGAMLDS